MRKKIVAGNWKMNQTFDEGRKLFEEITSLLTENNDPSILKIIAPSFIHIQALAQMAAPTGTVFLAGQNCHSEESGAYTGEISATMLKSAGAKYIILGHSERRTYFNETNKELAKKVSIVLKKQLSPIFCIGETLKEREEKKQYEVVKNQLKEGLFHIDQNDIRNVIIAYEPVWAIGTGITATADQAQEMHHFVRSVMKEQYDSTVSDAISILYGGSCNSSNAAELFACKDVDGGLIGGASLKAKDFVQIINSFSKKGIGLS